MTAPKFNSAAQLALQNILVSMLKADEAPCSAEMHLAQAVVILQQFVDCSNLDAELAEQVKYCMTIVTGKQYE